MFALSPQKVNVGNVRETFFLNQVDYNHSATYNARTDFLVNDLYAFEIDGKSKTNKQIIDLENAFVAADNIEFGNKNTIPLWLFGFLY